MGVCIQKGSCDISSRLQIRKFWPDRKLLHIPHRQGCSDNDGLRSVGFDRIVAFFLSDTKVKAVLRHDGLRSGNFDRRKTFFTPNEGQASWSRRHDGLRSGNFGQVSPSRKASFFLIMMALDPETSAVSPSRKASFLITMALDPRFQARQGFFLITMALDPEDSAGQGASSHPTQEARLFRPRRPSIRQFQ